MTDGIGAGLAGGGDLTGGDQRAGDAGAEEIILFVDRMSAEHREAIIAREFLPQVFDDDFVGAGFICLLLDALELVPLAQLGGVGDQLDAGISLFQPRQNDGSIESAGVGQNDFLRSFRCRDFHVNSSRVSAERVLAPRTKVYESLRVKPPGVGGAIARTIAGTARVQLCPGVEAVPIFKRGNSASGVRHLKIRFG